MKLKVEFSRPVFKNAVSVKSSEKTDWVSDAPGWKLLPVVGSLDKIVVELINSVSHLDLGNLSVFVRDSTASTQVLKHGCKGSSSSISISESESARGQGQFDVFREREDSATHSPVGEAWRDL